MTNHHQFAWTAIVAFSVLWVLTVPGCSQEWHKKYGWNSEVYFDDPDVVALCHAIEARNVAEVERLAKAGANINAIGKDNVTPLLWAFPGENEPCFRRLLELGADPNVMFDGHKIPPRGTFWRYDSVTHLSLRTTRRSYFDLVFQHGGDPNLKGGALGYESPITTLVQNGRPNRKDEIARLLNLGADIHERNHAGCEPVVSAVNWFGQYDLTLWLLKNGANPCSQVKGQRRRLIHFVVREEKRARTSPEKIQEDYASLVTYLEEQGESIEAAKKELEEWGIPYE